MSTRGVRALQQPNTGARACVYQTKRTSDSNDQVESICSDLTENAAYVETCTVDSL
jgi:hypothetical protein